MDPTDRAIRGFYCIFIYICTINCRITWFIFILCIFHGQNFMIFFHFQSAEAADFSLVEVLLDRGVTEREMEPNERIWQIHQQSKKVRKCSISVC